MLWKWRQRVSGIKFSIGKYFFFFFNQAALSESACSQEANIQVGEYRSKSFWLPSVDSVQEIQMYLFDLTCFDFYVLI